jgi:hypothetical protein
MPETLAVPCTGWVDTPIPETANPVIYGLISSGREVVFSWVVMLAGAIVGGKYVTAKVRLTGEAAV